MATTLGTPTLSSSAPPHVRTSNTAHPTLEIVSAEKVHWATCSERDQFKAPAKPKAAPVDRGFEFEEPGRRRIEPAGEADRPVDAGG